MEIEKLKKFWINQSLCFNNLLNFKNIEDFENKNKVKIPKDLQMYFYLINGTNESYDTNFFSFYDLNNFKKVSDELIKFNGIPDYSNLGKSLLNIENYYVFADYMFHLSSYAIYLGNNLNYLNEVILINGGEYKKIANSFSDFIILYLKELPHSPLLISCDYE